MAASSISYGGDLLRGGYAAGSAGGNTAGANATDAAAAQARGNAHDALARATQALQAVQAMQAAAQSAAAARANNLGADPNHAGRTLPNVPNGLVPGGLQVAPGVSTDPSLWQGARLPKQVTNGGNTVVTVEQTRQQAVLNWQSFNVGRETTLYFNQGGGGSDASQWIAFNKVNDPTGVPSQILGSIQAQGQVYVINQNGIIFGSGSQVNVHALVASSLPIDDSLLTRGLLNNPDQQFLFSAIAEAAGALGPTSAFVPTVSDPIFKLGSGTTYKLTRKVTTGTSPTISYRPSGSFTTLQLTAGAAADYTVSPDGSVVTFTVAGLAKLAGAQITVSYSTISGDVVVQQGAQLSTPTNAEHIGGRIALIGANVTNAGSISTPDGQTILAAGLQVGVAAHSTNDPSLRGLDVIVGAVTDSNGTATNSGLIEAPRADVTIAGKTVNQFGAIDSSTSVTLNGRVDLQADYNAIKVSAVGQNPSLIPTASGTVTLGSGSVTQILPELSSTDQVVGTSLALPSLVNIQGQAIHFGTDSILLAPNASLPVGTSAITPVSELGVPLASGVTLSAGNWLPKSTSPATNGGYDFIYQGGQIYFDQGALLNVAGTTDVDAPVSENFVSVDLRGTELADSPAQRTGPFRGTTINADLRILGPWDPTLNNGAGDYSWVGTPLANLRGYRDLIQRSVGELTTAGGTVTMNAGESVVVQSGAAIDVSGGWVNYQGAVVQTTRVISDGQIFDISQATPDRVYDGIYDGTFTRTFAKYGVSETYASPLSLSNSHFEQGYLQGASGGTIQIAAPSMALDGSLLGHTVAGPRQRTDTTMPDPANLPAPSSISLTFQSQKKDPASGTTIAYRAVSPTPPNIAIQTDSTQEAASPFALDSSGSPVPLSKDRQDSVYISPDLLSANGFGNLTIDDADGNIKIPLQISLATEAGGSITLKAANLDIQGKVSAPGGSLNFSVYDFTPRPLITVTQTPSHADNSRGQFTLGASASLSSAGLLVDDRNGSPTQLTQPLVINGGSITIAGYNVDLQTGSSIDVSGGVTIGGSGSRTYGNGGSISISAGQDVTIQSVLGGKLTLGATLKGYSGLTGGSLSILAPLIQIGGAALSSDTLLLPPEFFNQGGFGTFTLEGVGKASKDALGPLDIEDRTPGLLIAPGTILEPIVQNALAEFDPATGGIDLVPTLFPPARRTPVNLNFGSEQVTDKTGTLLVRGDLVMGAGSVIRTDPGGSVVIGGSATSADTVTILGSIYAPGGKIEIDGGKDSKSLFADASQALATVVIGRDTVLSTAGTTVLTLDPRGFHTGNVLNGGTITLSGNVVTLQGSVLDVSGATDTLDRPPAYSQSTDTSDPTVNEADLIINPLYASLQGSPMVPTRVDSSAGSITLKGAQELFSAATLLGASGGPSAQGGSLSISSGRFYAAGETVQTTSAGFTVTANSSGGQIAAPSLEVSQSSPSFRLGSGGGVGDPVFDDHGNVIKGIGNFAGTAFVEGGGHIGVDSFNAGGFDFVTLGGNVKFTGPVNLTANSTLTVASGGVLMSDETIKSPVTLAAPYVILGTPFQQPGSLQSQNPFTLNVAPVFGPSKLTVMADLIDIGNLVLQNIGDARFVADNGEIRGDGTLDVAGNIYLRAAQIYPPTEVNFTIAAYDYTVGGTTHPGSVSIVGSGLHSLPLSAGGTLSIYASNIDQEGTLVAPFGTINLGWDGTGTSPTDLIVGNTLALPTTQQITLGPGSLTSVSGIDPVTKEGVVIPYGLNNNGKWIDPSGTDITAGGLPTKAINLSAINVSDSAGSSVDLRGGGDLYAYQWVPGVGGSKDVLASSTSFAIIPSYGANYAPYAPFSSLTTTGGFTYYNPSNNSNVTDPGYVNSKLKVGDQIAIGASANLAAGTYTLLPARYALLPGAFLVTVQSGTPITSFSQADGSNIVSGYVFNDLNGASGQPLLNRVEVASGAVVRTRSAYNDFFANEFLLQGAVAAGATIPRLPIDAGHLVIEGSQELVIQGAVSTEGGDNGRGGLVDISSQADITIGGGRGASSSASGIVLGSTELNSFGAESLLIGGVREVTTSGTTVTVATSNLTVNNAGSPLAGPEIILVAKQSLTLAPGAEVEQQGQLSDGADTLLLGNASVPGSGDGVLFRVTSDPAAQIVRAGVSTSTIPNLNIGAGAQVIGTSLIIESTAGTTIDPKASIQGQAITLNSGQITILLDNSIAPPATAGLLLSGAALQSLEGARALSLSSYSSIDVYGAGKFSAGGTLALHAGEIRGFDNGGGVADFAASQIVLDDLTSGVSLGADPSLGGTLSGTLQFDAGVIRLGNHQLQIDQYANVVLNAPSGLIATGSGGLATTGALTANTPFVIANAGASQTITAAGALLFNGTGANATMTSGLGATLNLIGSSVEVDSNVLLPSGSITLRATTGDVTLGGRLDVSGTVQNLYDLVRYTDGGQISLVADQGSVAVTNNGVLSVAAEPDGGNAGSLSITAPGTSGAPGTLTLDGKVFGRGGTLHLADGSVVQGKGGTFSLDVGTLPDLATLDPALTFNTITGTGGFTEAQSFRVRSGDVAIDGTATAHSFSLSTDQGSIAVGATGRIDAHGDTGGTIDLIASGSVVLESGAVLTVAASDFNHAGKGGAVTLEAGAETQGTAPSGAAPDPATGVFAPGTPAVSIQSGSTIDLSVASIATAADPVAAAAAAAALGKFSGTLHLRAPQIVGNSDLQIDPIAGQVLGASSIVLEGYRIYIPAGGLIDSVESDVQTDATSFATHTAAIGQRIFGGAVPSSATIVSGAEIINQSGDLTLANDWDLSTFRFGTQGVPGILTLRASGNLVFTGALSDGFGRAQSTDPLYTATLLAQNPNLPVNAQSWSYRLTAGADFSAADFRRVQSTSTLASGSGSLLLGVVGVGDPSPGQTGKNSLTSDAVAGHYQVIRTGSGDIEISTAADVQLLNQFATIYTAGTRVLDAGTVASTGDFDVPILDASGGTLPGAQQQNPGALAQYSLAGGNVIITAQGDIKHASTDVFGNPIDDSEKELPINWLYRRGYVNPATGLFDLTGNSATQSDGVGSTTWWVDFSNYFEGVGALGGGNVTMVAGGNVTNVDALIPTNARMPGRNADGSLAAPNASALVELGGGDLIVRAGHDIDGGVYYVERGNGTLNAGNSIHTNGTRAASAAEVSATSISFPPETWLPTTLFLGKGSFNVSARGDVTLGPVANTFLLPEGYNNTFWFKTYFSTYATTDAVDVSSLGGDITFRESTTPTGTSAAQPLLLYWLSKVSLLTQAGQSVSLSQPWLRLDETSVTGFSTEVALLPPALRATAFSGSINLVGNLTLSPSSQGTIDLLAAGAVNGVQPNGLNSLGTVIWGSSRINLSDADPTTIPGAVSPLSYQGYVEQFIDPNLAASGTTESSSRADALNPINILFNESGSDLGAFGSLQAKQALHGSGVLHADDSEPIHLYAGSGDISGVTLFSGKAARVVAGNDITDVAFYIQNDQPTDVTTIAAGRDIVAYDPNSALLQAAAQPGNTTNQALAGNLPSQAGDIQIAGPGTVEVLAGRNLDLGQGRNPNDPTDVGVGITSVGNIHNPALPFGGASIVMGAGIGASAGLAESQLDFTTLTTRTLTPANLGTYLSELGDTSGVTAANFGSLNPEQQDILALEAFYLVLRDAGRDHNLSTSPGFGNYDAGFSAISSLFSGNAWKGDITLAGRSVTTSSGGNINLFAPGGQLSLGSVILNPPPGVVTQDGGNISIFTNGDVDVGTERIFTLRGGSEIIWSSTGNIAAGASSKTVQTAPPTRVLIDPQSGDVKTDLAGLATGGGIGVLATVGGVPPGDVDLIAPSGTVDAGDAGIRATGNLNIAAVAVLNADNIQVAGTSSGTPAPAAVAAPNLTGITTASNTAGAAASTADEAAKQARSQSQEQDDTPSIITVEVTGYGGGDSTDDSQ